MNTINNINNTISTSNYVEAIPQNNTIVNNNNIINSKPNSPNMSINTAISPLVNQRPIAISPSHRNLISFNTSNNNIII
jgi:hypothetical protein